MKARELFFIISLIPATASGEDSCKDILSNGFYNTFSRSSTEDRDRAMYAELCSSNFQQAQQTVSKAQQSGSGGSLGVSYGLFSLDGGGSSSSSSSFTEGKFNQWKNQYCAQNSSSDSSKAAEFLMQKTVAESVVGAWSECMQKREGLTCWANPYGEEVLFNISWKKTSLTKPQVQSSYLSKDAISEFEGATSGKLLPSGHSLNPGTLQVVISKKKKARIVSNVNANHDGVSYSCNIFVPDEADFQLQQPINLQSAVRSDELGCKAKAFPEGGGCHGDWAYIAPPNYKVCTIEIDYNGGPTDGATMKLDGSSNSNAGKVVWKVDSNPIPFGGGRWVSGYATVTYVPNGRDARDDGKTCAPTILSELKKTR